MHEEIIKTIILKNGFVCGADEAGRGPLVGPVVAACVILGNDCKIEGINDSKKLTEKKRESLFTKIKEEALAYGIGICSPKEIDEMNILHASLEAMKRAYFDMNKKADLFVCDGKFCPKDMPIQSIAVVKGDSLVKEVGAASILAKVTRDKLLVELDTKYPDYGFKKHKGYPTKAHLEILEKLPILSCYRMTYGPIKKLLAQGASIIDVDSSLK